MSSILDLESCGAHHVAEYCDLSSRYAWPRYDQDDAPEGLVPTDYTAPTYLSYPIRRSYLEEILRHPAEYEDDNAYLALGRSLSRAVEKTSVDDDFLSLHIDELSDRHLPGPWPHVLASIDAAQPCSYLTSVAVTKILHRKRPRLVPVNDTLVRSFYGVGNSYEPLFHAIHADLETPTVVATLDRWATAATSDQPTTPTPLRSLDIAIWMHQKHCREQT